MTPWHSTTVYRLDGSVATAHLDTLETSPNHELVYNDGVSWYYREKSDLYDWGNLAVCFEPLYPTGLIVTPVMGSAIPSLKDVDMDKIRRLAEHNSPIVIRGFAGIEEETVISKASEVGEIRGEENSSPESPR